MTGYWLLLALLALPGAAIAQPQEAVPPAEAGAKETPGGVEQKLVDRVREGRSEVRRVRRRIRKARAEGDAETVERLQERLRESRAEQRRRRERLLAAIENGEVSPRFRQLKREIKEDLNEVRRARYAMKKAVRRSNNREAVAANKRMLDAKRRLKRRRMLLRRMMKEGRERGPGDPRRKHLPAAEEAAATVSPESGEGEF
ncbi:MAG: hypothetical protein ABIJ96_08875 [Elusimicrobiota bacterium]